MNDLARAQAKFAEYEKMMEFGSGVDFDSYADKDDIAKIVAPSFFKQEVKDSFLNGDQFTGLRLPFSKVKDYRIKSGLIIHTGYNEHRKSLMQDYINLGLTSQDEQSLTISLEMKGRKTLKRRCQQFAGSQEPSLPAIDQFFDWIEGKQWIYNQVGTMKWKRVIGICKYAIHEKNIKQIFIDSLLKCGIKKTDYDTQCQFVDELSTLANDTQASIHLVAHSKKPSEIKNNNSGENKAPDKYAISGAAEISDMADDVIIHHKKDDDIVSENEFNQFIYVGKQRDPDGEDTNPVYGFRFDKRTMQFKPYSTALKMSMEDWINGRFN